MISLAKYFSATIEAGKRILKVTQFGTKTAKECGPFGFDSQPPEGWTAIYSETTNKDESIIIGYINKNQVVGAGESRMYSVGVGSEVKAYVVCDASGRITLNGNEFSAVRYENLVTGLNAQNTLINAELTKISLAFASLGVTYTVAPISTNITTAKSETIKIK